MLFIWETKSRSTRPFATKTVVKFAWRWAVWRTDGKAWRKECTTKWKGTRRATFHFDLTSTQSEAKQRCLSLTCRLSSKEFVFNEERSNKLVGWRNEVLDLQEWLAKEEKRLTSQGDAGSDLASIRKLKVALEVGGYGEFNETRKSVVLFVLVTLWWTARVHRRLVGSKEGWNNSNTTIRLIQK